MTANRRQGESFTSILTRSEIERVTVQIIPESNPSIIPSILHGSLEGLWDELEWLNRQGAGIFIMVNKGDGLGRKAENVVAVRSLFCDFDGTLLPSTWALPPHLVVESSPGHFHCYWLCNGVPLDDFGVLQRTLAKVHGGDPAVCDLPRCMRLPGLLHQKGAPKLVRLIEVNDHARYDYGIMFEAMPALGDALEAREQARVEAEARRQRACLNPVVVTSERVHRLLQAHFDAVAAAPEGQRHGTLLRHARALGGYVASGTVTLEDAAEALTAAAEVCGLPEAEAAAAIRWGLERGKAEPLYLEAQRFDEHPCSSNNSPWLSQKSDLTNTSTPQTAQGWDNDASPWGRGGSSWQ